MESFGRIIIVIGALLLIFGLVVTVGGKFGLGRLPGDIFIKKGNFTFYFPVITSIIISIVLTIIANIIFRK